MADLDLTFVDETVERLGRRPEATIAVLQAIQTHFPALHRATDQERSSLRAHIPK